MYPAFFLSVALVQFPAIAEYFKGLSLADYKCCLVHRVGGPKAKTTAETVVKSGVLPL